MQTELRKVPNRFPTSTTQVPYRIAIIGDCPSKDDEHIAVPFVGKAGQWLKSFLREAGIDEAACFFGNVSQIRPAYSDMKNLTWSGLEIQQGLDQLSADINIFQPNLILLLGAGALRAAKGTYRDKKNKEKQFPIGDWRGSCWLCQEFNSPFYNYKVLATYHPSYLMKVYPEIPLVRQDLKRARLHGTYKEMPSEDLKLDTAPQVDTICARLKAIRDHNLTISIDIEGYVGDMSCIGISASPKEAFIIPFSANDGGNYWSEDDEVRIWTELSQTISSPTVPKILQNGMYDAFVLAYSYKTPVGNQAEDTLIKNWSLYCEYPKDLGFLTSLWTEHPHYKAEGKSEDEQTFWRYCCKDAAITYEICERQSTVLKNQAKEHYQFMINTIPAFMYIELRGMRLDATKRRERINLLSSEAYFDNKNKISSGTEQLKLEEMVGWQINVNSPIEMKKLLYEQCKYPVQYERNIYGIEMPTANFEALLTLGKRFNDEMLMQCIKVRRIRKRLSAIEGFTVDEDGRIRTAISIAGSKTGRTSNKTSPTGKGTNLQTVTKDDRDLFLSDIDCEFNQNDLAGADGWTVAAHCARLGDTTMLDDYLYGIKPARVIALMVKHGPEVALWDRAKLKLMGKNINSDTDPDNNYIYFISKCCQHGSNYGMGPDLLALTIYLQSEGEINITGAIAKVYQELYFSRYKGVREWQEEAKHILKTKGFLQCASGQRRVFLGRKDQQETVNEFLSSEPQANTTYATNLALLNLWNDPENRRNGKLIVEPLHQIHDALCDQWHYSDREFSRAKIKQWFNNPMIIGGIKLTIPFEGNFGTSWGLTDKNSQPV